MSFLVATIDAQGALHVASSTAHPTVEEAWRAVFAFDGLAEEWWVAKSKSYPADSRGPWVDSVIRGSVFRWTLVEQP